MRWWGWGWIERIGKDIRYAGRTLRRSPGFSAAAILSLALGVGVNSATFSLADALLLRPLPIRNPADVVAISSVNREGAMEGVSYPEFRDIAEQSRSFSGVAAFRLNRVAIARSADTAGRVKMGMVVSRGFFGTLGVEPVLGRSFTDQETSAPGSERGDGRTCAGVPNFATGCLSSAQERRSSAGRRAKDFRAQHDCRGAARSVAGSAGDRGYFYRRVPQDADC